LPLARKTIDRELARLCDKRLPAIELKRTKEFLIGNFRLSHERVLSKMFFYGSMLLAYGRLVEPKDQVAKIAAVTAEEVQRAAQTIFREENRSVSLVLPR
jgi:predicted Zn-dependent peptidase